MIRCMKLLISMSDSFGSRICLFWAILFKHATLGLFLSNAAREQADPTIPAPNPIYLAIVWSTKTTSLISMGSELMCIEAPQPQWQCQGDCPFYSTFIMIKLPSSMIWCLVLSRDICRCISAFIITTKILSISLVHEYVNRNSVRVLSVSKHLQLL